MADRVKRDAVILGAGAVGVCAARELQKRGWRVTLIDRRPPAMETSHGNCGVVALSSAAPLNQPSLVPQLPKLALGFSPALRLRPSYALANLPWCLRFLWHCRAASARRRAAALLPLLARGQQLHLQWLPDVGLRRSIRAGGWLKLYKNRAALARAEGEIALWQELGISAQHIAGDKLNDYAPVQPARFLRGILLPDAFSISDPGGAIRAYADRFAAAGGAIMQAEATAAAPAANYKSWRVTLDNGDSLQADALVVALGPWSGDFCRKLGLRLPLCLERGAHRQFSLTGAAPAVPLHDVGGGYSASVQPDGTLRMTSGVYFAAPDAPPPAAQLAAAERHLRAALRGIGKQLGDDWFGARPTLPDSMPVIGPCTNGLWLATGGQHIGLATAPAVGELIAQQINGDPTALPAAPFSPRRFGL